jgi:hypothetical protein
MLLNPFVLLSPHTSYCSHSQNIMNANTPIQISAVQNSTASNAPARKRKRRHRNRQRKPRNGKLLGLVTWALAATAVCAWLMCKNHGAMLTAIASALFGFLWHVRIAATELALELVISILRVFRKH